MRGTPDMLVGLSQVALERNDLEAASGLLDRAEELGEHLGLPQYPYRRRVARARLLEAAGDLAGGGRPARGGRARLRRRLLPERATGPGACGHGCSWRRAGSAEAARLGARAAPLRRTTTSSYVREYEHVTLARILLRQAGRRALAGGRCVRRTDSSSG